MRAHLRFSTNSTRIVIGISIACSFRVPGRYRHLRIQSSAASTEERMAAHNSNFLQNAFRLTTALSTTAPCTRARLAFSG